MRRSILGLTVLVLIGTGGYTVLASNQCSKPCASSTQATAGKTGAASNVASCEATSGKVAGHFDPAMSGVCRFGCATKLKYKSKDVMAQPGAKTAKLTQCPVSGVVFAVDANRPHVRIANDDYVTCCDKCAEKLKRNPSHYLKV